MGFYTVKPVTATLKKTENWFSKPNTFIKLLFVIKIFVLYFYEWPFYTGFTVQHKLLAFQSTHGSDVFFIIIKRFTVNVNKCRS